MGADSNRVLNRKRAVDGYAFPAIVLMGLLVRIFVLWRIAGSPLASDSTDYREMASLLLGGGPFVPYWPPGLSLYLVPFLAAGAGDGILRASMLLWWLLFCFGFLRMAGDLRVRRELSLALLVIFTLAPAMIHFSLEPMTQMPAAALLLWAVSGAVRCLKGAGWGEALLMGASLGALSLVRPSAVPLLIAIPFQVALRRREWGRPAMAVVLGLAMVFAWIVKEHQLSGQWTLNNSNGINLYYSNNPWTPLYRTWYFGSHAKPGTEEIHEFPQYERVIARVDSLPEKDRGDEFKRLAVAYVLRRPDLFALRTVNRVRCFWGFDIFTAANLRRSVQGRRWFPVAFAMDAACYLAIAGFAFFWIAATPGALWRRWESWLLVGTVVLYAFPYWVTMSHPTYHFPVIAPLALLGAMACELARSSGAATRWRGWTALVVLALIQVEWMFYLSQS